MRSLDCCVYTAVKSDLFYFVTSVSYYNINLKHILNKFYTMGGMKLEDVTAITMKFTRTIHTSFTVMRLFFH
jgi:hypothetical protein